MSAQHKHTPVMRVIRGGDTPPPALKILNTQQAASVFRSIWDNQTMNKFESVYVIYLNGKNELVRHVLLNIGTKKEALINKRAAVQYALMNEDIEWVLIAHNHPSGICSPTKADLIATKELSRLFNDVDIKLIDHVILTQNDYYSFRDNQLIN